MLLNFLSVYLAAACFPRLLAEGCGVLMAPRAGEESGLDASARKENTRRLHRAFKNETALFAAISAMVYFAVPKPGGMGFSFGGFSAAVLFGATLRTLLYIFQTVLHSRRDFRRILLGMVSFLAVSWLGIVAASLTTGGIATVFLQLSRICDVLALIAGLIAIQSNFLILGFYHKTRADSSQKEAEKAKAELSLLSRVASDIYEDSNTMIQRQQDQSRNLLRRVESLEKILQIGITIQKRKNLKELLQMIAELIKDNLGFNTVILRLLNEQTQSFETKAHVGLSEEAEDAVVNYRLPVSEYERMIDPKSKISRSYFLRRAIQRNESDVESNEEAILLENQWDEIERLIVPLADELDNTIGYISVEDPDQNGGSIVETIENIETVATLAVIAIRNARFFKDIGEKNKKLNQYAEKLAGLNKMKSNFVATVSHEFRTPLTSIKAYCETLLSNVDNLDRDILKEFLVVIDEESDRLMTLIEDILDFSQMESGAARIERSVCNINEVIEAAAKELEKNFERKNITLHKQLPDEAVTIRAERELMKQLIVNLLHNASKFTEDCGEVRVSVVDETVSVRITVEDNGIGIPEDQVELVFDRFHQADNTSTRKHGGSGLGLAICKNIVDWHDGKIWVESAPGQGTSLIVIVPKKQAVVRSHIIDSYNTMRRFEVERYLELVVEMVAELMNVKNASIMMLDEEKKELRIESAIGVDEAIVESARVKLGEGISGKVALEKRSRLVTDVDNDAVIGVKNNDFVYDSKSFLSVPILNDGEVMGVINVSNPETKQAFDANDRQLLEVFAVRVGVALQKLIGFTAASMEFEEVRKTFSSMLDSRRYSDDLQAASLNRVLIDVARRLGLTAEESATLQYAFSVYDLGLAKVAYSLGMQPKPLSGEDRTSVEQHTIVGTDMIKRIELTPSVRNAVLYHHENFDGTGYPGKLSGEEIPVYARIIRVADSFRALISHRPYQNRYTLDEALDVLEHRAGTFFDPKIVNTFIEVVRKNSGDFQSHGARVQNELTEFASHQAFLKQTPNCQGGS